MAAMTRSIRVRAPLARVAPVLGDPAAVMAAIGSLGRTAHVGDDADGAGLWDVFILLGTMYVGGRVRVDEARDGALAWHAVSGFRHAARFGAAAEPDPEASTITMRFEFRLDGSLSARLAGWLVRGYIGRYADAVLETLRHRVEYG